MLRQKQQRASSVKALQAIKENGKHNKVKRRSSSDTENCPANGVKRQPSPTSMDPPLAKRNALGNITNAVPTVVEPIQVSSLSQVDQPRRSKRLLKKSPDDLMEINEATPITIVRSVLEATTLNDDSFRSDEKLCDVEESTQLKVDSSPLWKNIDEAEAHDPLFSSEYAPSIYEYMIQREEQFEISPYLDQQPFINASMRAILIDWLVEVQENFELFHETLYMAVKIVDRYLEQVEVKKEYLQLVGATSMLVAAKFEELSPPLVDDFIYLCDDAYEHNELLSMEREILSTLNYDINVPIAYRFLRRLARAADASMETHTLARYISESTLQEYDFVSDKPSHIAAASMYLAIRMKKIGSWTPTLQHYSGYKLEELLPLVHRLNDLISQPKGNTSTVRSKYSHEVFYRAALTPPLVDVDVDAKVAISELELLMQKSLGPL